MGNLTLSPILKVLSTFRKQKVKALLIGGQACIAYGAAEFSRDSDFVVLASPGNIRALKRALTLLKAAPVYFPVLSIPALLKGHACRFRCRAAGVGGLRVDIMAKLKGCEPFPGLWSRRNRVRVPGAGAVDIIALEDLVRSKNTQRDKDWLMLGRLVENDVFINNGTGPAPRIRWWRMESRSPETLVRLCAVYPALARKAAARRPLLRAAAKKKPGRLEALLAKEEASERAKDLRYWKPLRKELEQLRLARDR